MLTIKFSKRGHLKMIEFPQLMMSVGHFLLRLSLQHL